MKTIFLLIVVGYISTLLATHGASAQNPVSIEIFKFQKEVVAVDKGVRPGNPNAAVMGAINSKALKAFAKSYKNVSSE